MDSYLLQIGLIKNQAHSNICVQRIGILCVLLGFYVDDLIFVNNQISFLDSIKSPYIRNLKRLILKKLHIFLVYKSSTIETIRNSIYPKKKFK